MRSVRFGDFLWKGFRTVFINLMPEKKRNIMRQDEICIRFFQIIGIRRKTRTRRFDMGFLILIGFAIYGLGCLWDNLGGE